MAISLAKGENTTIDPGLTNITVGLGWNPSETPGVEFDLDASCFLLNAQNKVRSDADFIFYNQPTTKNGSVKYGGDSRTGAGNGDDETIQIELPKVDADVQSIIFTVTIYKGKERKQNFGMVRNAYIRLVNNVDGQEIMRFELTEDAGENTALIFAKLYRRDGQWKFGAIGQGYDSDLGVIAGKLGVNIK